MTVRAAADLRARQQTSAPLALKGGRLVGDVAGLGDVVGHRLHEAAVLRDYITTPRHVVLH